MAISANSKTVIKFLQANHGSQFTAQDIATATGLTKQQVNGIFTSAIQKKGYGVRIEAEVENADGTHDKVKLLQLTNEGMSLDVDAEDEE